MLDDFILSLPPRYFERDFDAFWVRTIIALANQMGEETDAPLECLVARLLDYHSGGPTSGKEIDEIPHEIVRLRGPSYWRDDSVLGRKYRVINAIASSAAANDADPDNWMYGVVTAFQLLNLSGDKDDEIVSQVKSEMKKFEECRSV